MMTLSVQLRTIAFRLLPVLVFVLALRAAPAAPAPATSEVVVLVAMDGVSVDELADWKLPAYRELFSQGAVALLNNRTAEAPIRESNAVTISAGARSYGYEVGRDLRGGGTSLLDYAGMGANADEWVDGVLGVDLLKRNTGAGAPLQAVVHPGIAGLNRINETLRYRVTPGLLGEAMQKGGVKTGAYGNADRGKERDRSISLIAMNTAGWADFGDVGEGSTLSAPDRPFGLRTNYPFFLSALGSLPAGKYFIVIDAGDGARLEAIKPLLSPKRYEALKKQAAQECGAFVLALHRELDQRTARHRIILLNAAPSSEALERGDQLSPVVMLGSDVVAGMLRSPSTRRPGLVLNTDLTASVLQFFNAKPTADLRGNPAVVIPGIGSFARLVTMNRQMIATFIGRGPVIKGYLFVLAISLLASLAVVLMGARIKRIRALAWTPLLRPLLTAVMLGPLVFLTAPALHIYSTLPTALYVTIVSLAAAGALHRWVRDLRLIFAVVGVTALALSIDVLSGVPLLRQSMYSYDPIAGIRFYGLGNESAGALIGTALLGVFALLDYCKAPRWWLIPAGVFFLGLVVLDGAPMWGADFGGILAGLAGYGIALLKARGTITRRMLIAAAIGALVIFAALVIYNITLPPGSQSHVGIALNQAREFGPGLLVQTAVRKWSMNLYLMQSSWWAFALASLLTVVIVIFFRPAGILRRTLRSHPLLNAAFVGDLAAMLVALCTNDSGVVMAAVGMLYLAAPILLLIQTERDKESTPVKAAAKSA